MIYILYMYIIYIYIYMKMPDTTASLQRTLIFFSYMKKGKNSVLPQIHKRKFGEHVIKVL